jgi:acyl-coenzyme A thioesterase PaaI-like protein
MFKKIIEWLPENLKNKLALAYFGFFKIPLIGFVGPKIIEMNEEKTIIKVPLNRRTKNHLNSMYFGAMATAADVTSGYAAMSHIFKSGKKIHLSFKDFEAQFLKRAEGDTLFENNQGREIENFVREVIKSGERMNMPIKIVATVPEKFGSEPVAKFTLTLSLKLKD